MIRIPPTNARLLPVIWIVSGGSQCDTADGNPTIEIVEYASDDDVSEMLHAGSSRSIAKMLNTKAVCDWFSCVNDCGVENVHVGIGVGHRQLSSMV